MAHTYCLDEEYPLPWPVKESQFGIELAAKTVDEDPASFKRWISRKEIKSAKM